MSFDPKPVKSVTFTADDGRDVFAIVLSEDGDKVNLAWLDPDTYSLHAENAVAKSSERLS